VGLGLIAALSRKTSVCLHGAAITWTLFSFLFPVTLHTRTAHVFDMGMMISEPYRIVLFLAISVAFLQCLKCQDENSGKLLFIHEAIVLMLKLLLLIVV